MVNNVKVLSIAGIIAVLVIGSIAYVATKDGSDIAPSSQNIPQDTTPKKFFTIKYLFYTTSASTFEFAEELGYLEEEGIKLERVGVTTGGPEMIMAVSGGGVDLVGSTHWTAYLNAIARGTKVRPVITSSGFNNIERSSSLIVLNDSGINGAKDLRGKKIAVNTLAASGDYQIRTYLKKNEMSIKDVQLVVIPPAQNEQVLRSRQVDVVWTGNPVKGKILEGGGAREIEGTTAYEVYEAEIGSGGFAFREDFIQANPDVIRGFVKATAKAIDWAREHPNEARELYAKVLKKNQGNPENAKYWNSFGVREHGLITDSDVQYWIDILESEGKIEKGKYKPADFYTNEFNPYYKK